MRVLLLRPFYGANVHSEAHGDLGIYEINNSYYPDLVFINAATILSRHSDYDTTVIDAMAERISPLSIIKSIECYFDEIIIKATAPTIQSDLQFCRMIHEKFPKTKIYIAGHIAKIIKKWIYKNCNYIYDVIEEPLDFYVYKKINNVSSCKLDDLPTPDYTVIPYEKYRNSNDYLLLTMQTSRGCPMQCGYCPYNSFYGSKIDCRSTSKVAADLEALLKLNPSAIQFRDQYFTYDKKRIAELCDIIISKNLKFNWTCETRIDDLDFKTIDLMKKAGLQQISFGIESANDEILKGYNRKCSKIDLYKSIIEYLHSCEISTLAFYIIGFPEDDWSSVEKTYSLALELNTTLAKFSAFEPCVILDENKEITPELFVPFDNSMNIETKSKLSKEAIEYIVELYTHNYYYHNNSLKNLYEISHLCQKRQEYVRNTLSQYATDISSLSEIVDKLKYVEV